MFGNQSGLRTSILNAITRRASTSSEDACWEVGGRYEVTRKCALYDQPKLAKKIGDVKPKDVVLLLAQHATGSAGMITGLVVPPTRTNRVYAGWMLLKGRETQSLRLRKTVGSWEKKARYRVRHPALVREELSIDSAQVCEVQPLSEVLILDIGVFADGCTTNNVRLRLQVKTDEGDIGWLSPETGTGDKLLDPVNMLGMDVIKAHKEDVKRGSHRGSMKRLSGRENPSEGSSSKNIPWEVGCRYRVLEEIKLKGQAGAKAKRLCKVPKGALVTILDARMAECKKLGSCPFALVDVGISSENTKNLKHRRGWVRCCGKDGRDLIDTRDQLEFDKTHARLSQVAIAEEEHQLRKPGKKQTTFSLHLVEGQEFNSPRYTSSESQTGDEEETEEEEDAEEEEGYSDEWQEDEKSIREHNSDDEKVEGGHMEDITDNASDCASDWVEAEPSDRLPEGDLVDPKLPASVTQQMKATNMSGLWSIHARDSETEELVYELTAQDGGRVIGRGKPKGDEEFQTSLEGNLRGNKLEWIEYREGEQIARCKCLVSKNHLSDGTVKLENGKQRLFEGERIETEVDHSQLQKDEFAKKLQSMEIGAKDDRMVDDKTILTDEKYCCACNCGAY